MKKCKVIFFSLLIIMVSCVSVFNSSAGADNSSKIKKIFDNNKDKIFENLAEKIASASIVEELPILVVFKEKPDSEKRNQLIKLLGNFINKHEYKNFPSMAMALNIGEILALASLDMVKHIEYDKPVTFAIDDAKYWFGVENARFDFGLTGDGVVVAIIDSGIDATHVDLDDDKIVGWKDFIKGRQDPYDDNGHGTACAGIIAGDGEGYEDAEGVASGAKLVGVKVMPESGLGLVSTILSGIDWCIDNKDLYNIDVINISLGSAGLSDGTDAASMAVEEAIDNGMVVVVAAGNEGPGRETIGIPAAAEKAITVGAMADVAEDGFYLLYFSSRGPTADDRIKPDIVAPGLYLTGPMAGTVDQYGLYSGTSLSAPFVSGTVALMLEADSDLTPAEIKTIMTDTAEDWGEPGKDSDYGSGRLDAYEAIKEAGSYSGMNIDTPDLLTASEHLSRFGADDIWEFEVDDTQFPIAITLIENSTSCFLSSILPIVYPLSFPSNVDIFLMDSEGNILEETSSRTRQADLSYYPSVTGIYKLKITSKLNGLPPFISSNGSADYTFDICGGLNEPGGLTLIQDQ